MNKFEKPLIEVILLDDDIIVTSLIHGGGSGNFPEGSEGEDEF